ncbi:MAG: YmdB family metallophosphoesterase [Candidatus Riflebacteria bacterium]|nr:YmdB family metallophosphoesterase [Candidatus Riflebacteria bacterium]
MRLLLIGDIVGSTGRRMLKTLLPDLRKKYSLDWVIANGENATGGTGLSPKHRDEILAADVDLITGGNHFFARPDWTEMLETSSKVIRPHNIGGDDFPGKGWTVLRNDKKPHLGVINLAGRVFMEHWDCPFRWATNLVDRIGIHPIIIDLHAEATSEKIAMAMFLDGKISFLAGTHTHVQTSDERILKGGTGMICDLGMTGPLDGILGVKANSVIHRFLDGYSERFICSDGPGVLEGVLVEIAENFKCSRIRRIRVHENGSTEKSFLPEDF